MAKCKLTGSQIKRAIAQDNMNGESSEGGSIHKPLSNEQWEAFTQVGGPLRSPNFGPGGVNLRYKARVDIPFEEEDSAQGWKGW